MHAPTPFKKHPLALAIQACCCSMLGVVPLAQAGPTGGAVVGGSGAITQSGLSTTVNQASQNMAVNWQSFDVNANERVQFIQPNAASIALNRILSNSGSTIAGRIDANGRVILVNANGVFFTPTASLNVGSIIASGLDITPADFMNGNYIFNDIPGTSGKVVNSGLINASLGGNVALLGKQVENDGLISATLGTVSLAAGKQAVLTFDNSGLLGVRVSEAMLQKDLGVDPAVINNGQIQAQGGRVLLTASVSQDVFSKAVNTTGAEPATSVVMNADGSFTLGDGADVMNTGAIDTSATGAGQNAGRVVLLGENVTSRGTIKADAANGNGGEIELHARDTTLLTQNSLTSARAEDNGQGGVVKVLGDKVGMFDQSTVDVSGAQGGGQALIGGDYQGKNSHIRSASATIVSRDATVSADALQNGDGGKVIVWADGNTSYLGSIFARGGAIAGNGGIAETSGKATLLFEGRADLSATLGKSGSLLLDPLNLEIRNSGTPTDLTTLSPNVTFGSPTNQVSATSITSVLASTDVTLQATTDITVTSAIAAPSNTNSAHTLTLQAGDDIWVNNSISLGINNLTLVAGTTGCGGSCATGNAHNITVDNAASIYSSGRVNFAAADSIFINGAIDGGTLTVRAGDNITLDASGSNNGAISTNGVVTLTAADALLQTEPITPTVAPAVVPTGNITVYGNVTTNSHDFTAKTTSGYFDNWNSSGFFDINSGAGKVDISTDGNDLGIRTGTITGAFLGKITASTLDVVTTAGQIVQTTANDTNRNLDITNTATFNAGNNPIDLQNAANSLNGTVSLTTTGATNNATLWNSAASTILGTINVGGNLDIHASRDLRVMNTPITSGGDMTLAFGTLGGGSYSFCYLNGGACADSAVLTGPTLTSTSGNLSVTGGTGDDTFNLAGLTLTAPTAGKSVSLNGATGSDTVIGQNLQTAWTVTTPGAGSLSNTSGTVAFAGMDALTGGSDDDTFIYQVDPSLAGLAIDGGTQSIRDTVAVATSYSGFTVNISDYSNIERFQGNSSANTLQGASGGTNTWSITGVNSGTVNGVEFVDFPALLGGGVLGAGSTADLFTLVGSGSITGAGIDGNGGNDTLTGPDAVNTWTISGINSGSINTTSFAKVQTLTGGNTTDTFQFNGTGSIAGLINGGDGSDTLDRTALASDVTVQLLHGNNPALNNLATINTTNVETINANTGNTVTNTLIGDNTVNTWTLTGTNAGNVDSVSPNPLVYFTGFKNLTGGGLDDTFVYQPLGKVNGLIDGKGGTNTVDLSALATVNVSLSNGIAGVSNIAEIIGNDTASTLTGDNSGDTWTISGANSGSVAGITSLTFRRFNNLVGGTGGDTYNITSNAGNTTYGSISGSITDNAGAANHLNADITHVDALAADGQVVYVGGGADTVSVTGTAPSGWNGSYTPGLLSSIPDQITYTNTTTSFTVNYKGVGLVTDTASVADYRINGTLLADTFTLGAGSVSVGSKLISYGNKGNLILDGGSGSDSLVQNPSATLTLPGGLTLASMESINGGAALRTAIGAFGLLNSGPLTLTNTGALTLGPINSTSLVDITATGAVASSSALASTAAFNVHSGGNISLTGAGSALSGPLTLIAPITNSVTLNNTGATTLAGVTASDLGLTTTGNIGNTGTVNVANSYSLQTTGDITLSNLDHITTGSMTAQKITLGTLNGIGTGLDYINPSQVLSTTTSSLDVTNVAGNVYIDNHNAVSASIITSGNINFSNNADITVRQLNANGGDKTIQPLLGGNIYLSTTNGSAFGNPAENFLLTPDIVAQNFTGVLSGSPRDMGQLDRRMSVLVRNNFTLFADNAYLYYFDRSNHPTDININANVFEYVDFSGLNELLINIESLGDFDPAIFTAVRNYYYEDVAIMMPADQRLGEPDEDENDNDKKNEEKKL